MVRTRNFCVVRFVVTGPQNFQGLLDRQADARRAFSSLLIEGQEFRGHSNASPGDQNRQSVTTIGFICATNNASLILDTRQTACNSQILGGNSLGGALFRVLTTSARKPPLRSARFEAEIALLPFSPRRFGPVTRFVVAREAFSGTNEFAVTRFCAV
jgi:hypothetical protein